MLIENLLADTGMDSAKAVGRPTDRLSTVTNTEASTFNINYHAIYRSVVETLMYLAKRKLSDLAVPVSVLPSHLHGPSNMHLTKAKLVLRYLKWTFHFEMKIKADNGTQLTVYVDASWENVIGKGRRSLLVMSLVYGNAEMAAAPNLQKCVSLSSTDVEHVAFSEAAKTIVWLRNELTELGFEQIPVQAHKYNERVLNERRTERENISKSTST